MSLKIQQLQKNTFLFKKNIIENFKQIGSVQQSNFQSNKIYEMFLRKKNEAKKLKCPFNSMH